MTEKLTDPETGLPIEVVGTVGGETPDSSPPAETPSTPETPPAPATETPTTARPDAQPSQVAPEGGQEHTPAITPPPADLTALNELIKKQVTEGIEAVTKGLQSSSDRRVSVAEKTAESAETRHQAVLKEFRDLQMRDLTDEEKATLQARLSQEDRSAELQKWEDDLTSGNREFNVTTLIAEHGEYVTEAELNEIDDVERLEPFCLEKRVSFLEAKLEAGGTIPPASETAPTTVTPPAANQPQVPAGATAGSDVGGSGIPPQGTKFNPDATPEAMEDNYRNTPWEEAKVAPPRR